MATNEIFDRGQELALVATDPTTPASGDMILNVTRISRYSALFVFLRLPIIVNP